MKIKKKGKVHPSPSSSSSSNDIEVVVLSVLSLLPQAILSLASVLPLQDREVLAYMITRSSLDSSTSSKKQPRTSHNHKTGSSGGSKTPTFGCECFDCYTAYWFRWDSSPNRDLIHRAIDAFEDHLSRPNPTARPNRNKKPRPPQKQLPPPAQPVPALAPPPPDKQEADDVAAAAEEEAPEVVRTAAGGTEHRGLARKVLPDVLGLFNSRLWSLWSPDA